MHIYIYSCSFARHRFTNAPGGWPTMLPSARRGPRHLATQNIFKGCVGESSQLPSGQNATSRLLWKPNLVATKGARISDLLSILAASHPWYLSNGKPASWISYQVHGYLAVYSTIYVQIGIYKFSIRIYIYIEKYIVLGQSDQGFKYSQRDYNSSQNNV